MLGGESSVTVVSLWEKACGLLRKEMNEVSFRTWITGSLKPVELVGDVFVVEVVTDYMKQMIVTRYHQQITDALCQAAGHPIALEMLSPLEVKERKASFQSTSAQHEEHKIHLNPNYTFDSFVVGGGNRFAHAASLAVAEVPSKAYNPLFIYGGVGLGKTHLMHAIGHYVQEQYPELKLMYITSENFTNELITAIQTNKNVEFRNRFRNVDILMVDDIQFIAGRDSTQEEFFHTFNALHTAGKQIILTSDKPPKDIARLEDRLCSRFEWGLIADIQRPDIETRIAILRKKAQRDHLVVPDDVLEMIAQRIDSNIRELEGSLVRLSAFSSLSNKPIDMPLAEEALREIFLQRESRRITCPIIQETVASYYSITVDDLKSPKRNRDIAVPRQVAMYLTREMLGLSLPKIGEQFGGRDHTTVIHSCDKIVSLLKENPAFLNQIDDIRKQLAEGK
ncbi:MAG: chromosomal replication initiator protein DnaA [Clostridiales bacterium]|nr:chromosomal replication initiator protein DnaA [Clostridiales bacterium]